MQDDPDHPVRVYSEITTSWMYIIPYLKQEIWIRPINQQPSVSVLVVGLHFGKLQTGPNIGYPECNRSDSWLFIQFFQKRL